MADTESLTKLTNLQTYLKSLDKDKPDGPDGATDIKASADCSTTDEQQQYVTTNKEDLIVISESPTMGRRVLATRDIMPGEILLRDTSLFPLVPGQGKSISCLGCLVNLPDEEFPQCKNCGAPLCSDSCDGRLHTQEECTVLARAGLLAVTDKELKTALVKEIKAALMVIRILHDLVHNKAKIHLLWALESNLHKRKLIPGGLDKEKQLAGFINSQLSVPVDEDLVLHICGVYDTNSFTVPVSNHHTGIGCALLPAGSMINHSCLPNTEYSYADNMFYVRSTVFIPAGSDIFINYSRALWGSRARKGSLMHSKLFICQCQRCIDPTELSSHISSIKCGKCPGLVVPSMRDAEPWRCNTCNGTIATSKADTIVQATGQYIRKVPRGNVERLKEASDLIGQHLGTQHFIAVELRHRLVQALMKNKEELSVVELFQVLDVTQGLLDLADIIMPGKTFFRGHMLLQKVNAAAEIIIRDHIGQIQADQHSSQEEDKCVETTPSVTHDKIEQNQTSNSERNQPVVNGTQSATTLNIENLLEAAEESQDILTNDQGQSIEAILLVQFFRRLIKH